MKNAKMSTILVLVAGLVVCLGQVGRAGPMGTAFTYQGRLMDANGPADGLYDFQFKLFDDANIIDGNQVGWAVYKDDVDVIDGHVVVELDFFQISIFNGDARWLETTVAQSDGSDPCTLTPRVELTPTPYALYAKTSGGDNDWMISGNDMYSIPSGNVGIGTTNPDEKLTVEGTIKVSTPEPSGYGVYSEATNSGYYVNFGGYFAAAGYNGVGIYGYATGGVGLGVYGEAANTGNYTNYGGYFRANGHDGRGVSGIATGNDGRGVSGLASNNGNYVNYGGYFKASGQQGRGVYGEASTGEVNYGGYFKAAGNNGAGVYGEATGLAGRAVHGEATYSGNSTNFGGYFKANGQTGRGVFGQATGSNGKGVQAWGGQYDFYANGPGLDYGANSSIRWKSDVRVIDDPLGKVMNLRGVYFNWDDEHGGHHDVGMIAEEVGEVMPEIVVYEENGIDANGMEYGKLTPLLVEAVKELKVENDSLKERVEALERTMLQLAKVKELEL